MLARHILTEAPQRLLTQQVGSLDQQIARKQMTSIV